MQHHPVLLIRGVYNLCNGTVDFIIRKDSKKQFCLISLQSEAGSEALHHILTPEGLDSVVLIDHGHIYIKSDAAIEAASLLPLP